MERGGPDGGDVNCCDSAWDVPDLNYIHSILVDVPLPDTDDPYSFWNQTAPRTNVEIDASLSGATSQDKESTEIEIPRKRGRGDAACSKVGSKACRERLRREKLNDRFAELCSILEPGRPVKTDKLAILGDAIQVVNQLKSEAQEYREMNKKLAEEIETLKADKNELREEKLLLKAEKDRMEQQLKAMSVPAVHHPAHGFMAPHPVAYQAGMNKMAIYPGYGFVPMYQYIQPPSRDASQPSPDHELWSPAA